MDPRQTSAEMQKRRSFTIRTEFGNARQWKSRKNRPCDVCRRRKTACVIETRPPCRFCQAKGLLCQSTEDGQSRRRRTSSSTQYDVSADDCYDQCQLTNSSPRARGAGSAVSETADENIQTPLSSEMASDPMAGEAFLPPSTHPSSNDRSIGWSNSEGALTTYMRSATSCRRVELPLYTLEDGKNLTAHSMGLCGEQDTDLLASFRSVIMNETNRVDADVFQVFAGDLDRRMPPIHFNILHDEFQISDDIAKARASEAVEAIVNPHGPALIQLFFKYVHPVYCVVSKVRFLKAYATDKLTIPASLRGAVYGLGSMFWQHDPETEGNLPFNQHDLFEEAQSSLQREFHAPNLWNLQACLLLLHERPADNATCETPRTWIFSAQAVACSQMIGLHRDPKHWQISSWEKDLRRKLWWGTYLTDVWSSVCHGNPPHIYPSSFTTAPPNMGDLAFDEDVPEELQYMVDASSRAVDVSTSARFLEFVKLSQILHELMDSHYSDYGHQQSSADPLLRETNLLRVKAKLENWSSLIPHCVTVGYSGGSTICRNNAPLRLAFFAVKSLLLRALMSPASMIAKSDPKSSLRRYFNDAFADFSFFTLFMNELTPQCLHGFWGAHARSQLILCGNFLIYLFLLAPSPAQVQATFQLLERYHESLLRLREWADDDASIALLRPAALRMDSFFTQAAQIMRAGCRSDSVSGAHTGMPS